MIAAPLHCGQSILTQECLHLSYHQFLQVLKRKCSGSHSNIDTEWGKLPMQTDHILLCTRILPKFYSIYLCYMRVKSAKNCENRKNFLHMKICCSTVALMCCESLLSRPNPGYQETVSTRRRRISSRRKTSISKESLQIIRNKEGN